MESADDRRTETVDQSEQAVMWQVQWRVMGLGSWSTQDCDDEASAWEAYEDLCNHFARVRLVKTTVDQCQG